VWFVGEAVAGAALDADVHPRRTGAGGQLAAAGDEVGVDVRLDGVGDREAMPSGQLQVDVHVAARVDDGGVAGTRVANQVRQVGEPVGAHRLEDGHRGGPGRGFTRLGGEAAGCQHQAAQAGSGSPPQERTA